MKWIGLAAIALALLGAGLASRFERRNPALADAITARIEIGQIVFRAGGLDPAASITITPPDQSGPLLLIRPIRRDGSGWIDRPVSGLSAGDYRRPCASLRANRCQQRFWSLHKHYQ